MRDLYVKKIFNVCFDLFDPGIVKFKHLPGFIKNEMIMLYHQICLLKLSVIRAKLMLGNQAAIKK